MFREFLAWWGRQLLGLLPVQWRGASSGARSADGVLVNLEQPGPPPRVAVALRRRRRNAALGVFSLDQAGIAALRAAAQAPARRFPVQVILPSRLLLEQVVTLPLAAERGIDGALRFEMDRLTPFRAEDLYWSWVVERRDRAAGKLHVRLLLVPRRLADPVLDGLRAAGLSPSVLLSAPAQQISLASHTARPWQRRVNVAAAACCAALFLVAAAVPFLRQSAEADRMQARIAELRPKVAQADALRRGLQASAASADAVAAESARVGDPLRVLADLTDILPDDTSLIELSLRDRALSIAGQSAAAARLIPALAADPAIRNPAFAAPVTRNELSGIEDFSIRAEIAP